ncbi:BirA family transcriptional regulator, biotin operon repressor / biotin-[acetyl-CoA-carboxylase] ligase [Pelagirhabdus alkalitolerans]|uniref:Bifunctional ligase/repressor BirA n=1 Tax=Pelagirhabdus alkalitolerans TaxID=1612202 RepID=A0A1G6HAG3_9BACI|nr:biotin--[acetyl-CoA-carboxylase] ligase [Pelagirhabdus alkalitolerans]SDB91143.1 BirA family transcriptional regulator, biotin operon repressor / biotin-[acetyl-CoA-carboxylase] ligase [Pelagirhabdus alkalitolerans]
MASTREQLITLLSSKSNTFVSGQWISEQLNLSRTAVWKQIKQLKSDGYVFEAVPNKGYRLVTIPDKVSENTLVWGLETKWLGREVEHYSSLDSTQTLAKKRALEDGHHGLVVVADKQNKGKGRLNRYWESDHDQGVWMSFVLKPDLEPSHAPQLTLLTAVVLAETIESISNVTPQIKWPNDLLLDGKKVAGILTEMQGEQDQIHFVVIGLGLNLNQKNFSKQLSEIATSLCQHTTHSYDKNAFIQAFLTHFEQAYDVFIQHGFDQVRNKWLTYGFRLNETVSYQVGKKAKTGQIRGITDQGALIIENDQKQEYIYSGEIDWFKEDK